MTSSTTTTSRSASIQRKIQTRIGVVTSDKRNKTRTVMVSFQSLHSKYGKYLRRRQKINVHDPGNTSKLGDRVEIAACRPISKTKSWRLVRVVSAAVAGPDGLLQQEPTT